MVSDAERGGFWPPSPACPARPHSHGSEVLRAHGKQLEAPSLQIQGSPFQPTVREQWNDITPSSPWSRCMVQNREGWTRGRRDKGALMEEGLAQRRAGGGGLLGPFSISGECYASMTLPSPSLGHPLQDPPAWAQRQQESA